ncbi:MAG: hypothetical protein ACO3DH_09090 [Candidatus Kapaibacteriota bacterium]
MTRLFSFFILLTLLYSIDVFGQITTKGGLKVNLYMTGSKGTIIKEEFSQGVRGGIGRYTNLIEKIVFTRDKKSLNNPDINVEIEVYEYKEKEEECVPKLTSEKLLLLRKDISGIEYDEKKYDYTLPINPWIDRDGIYRFIIKEEGKILLDFDYCIQWWSGY